MDIIQVVKAGIAAAFAVVVGLLGGWDNAVTMLLALIGVDFALGVLRAIKQKDFRSGAVRWGAVNKTLEFLIVMVFNHCDTTFGTNVFRNAAIGWFCVCEGGSILENLAAMGVPMPAGIKDALGDVKEGLGINFLHIMKQMINSITKKD